MTFMAGSFCSAMSSPRKRGPIFQRPRCAAPWVPAFAGTTGSVVASDSSRIECRLLAGAVTLERALLADRVRALEDPVLPGGEAGEDLRLHGLRPAEAQIGFEPGQSVGRETCALLQEQADLVLPVD